MTYETGDILSFHAFSVFSISIRVHSIKLFNNTKYEWYKTCIDFYKF